MHSILANHYLDGMLLMAIGNCAITAMPQPAPNGNKFYSWLFNFAHALVLAIPRLVSVYQQNQKADGAQNKIGG